MSDVPLYLLARGLRGSVLLLLLMLLVMMLVVMLVVVRHGAGLH